MANYEMIEEFHSPSDTLIQELAIYCRLNNSVKEFKDLKYVLAK